MALNSVPALPLHVTASSTPLHRNNPTPGGFNRHLHYLSQRQRSNNDRPSPSPSPSPPLRLRSIFQPFLFTFHHPLLVPFFPLLPSSSPPCDRRNVKKRTDLDIDFPLDLVPPGDLFNPSKPSSPPLLSPRLVSLDHSYLRFLKHLSAFLITVACPRGARS